MLYPATFKKSATEYKMKCQTDITQTVVLKSLSVTVQNNIL